MKDFFWFRFCCADARAALVDVASLQVLLVLTHQKISYHLTIRDDAKIKILKSKNSMKILFLKNILLLDGFQPFSLLSSDTNMVLSLKRSKKM